MAATKLQYWEDTFLFESIATVLQISNDPNSSSQTVILNTTIFYPAGGGQPTDTGTISTPQAPFQVTEVKLIDRNTVIHNGKFEGDNTFAVGDQVSLKVDAEKRLLHAKLHSAGHLLDSALENVGVKLVPGKGYHYPDGPYVEYSGKIPGENREEIWKNLEREANRLVSEASPVLVEMASPQRVEEMYGSFPDYLPKTSDARMVKIGGLWCPCGGTHVRDLSQIGQIKVTKIRVQKDKTKISYAVV